MSDWTLHPAPRLRDVAREQIRIVGLSLRREALVAAVVLAIVMSLIVADIVRGNAATWFDSDEWVGLGLISFFLPFAVWRRERPFGPAFLWTLPVDRRRLALAKVFGGWVWLIAAVSAFVLWQTALASVSGVPDAETVTLFVFPGTTATYLFGSALVLGLRHPLRALLGTAGVFFLIAMLNETLGPAESGEARLFAWSDALRWLIYGPYGVDALQSLVGNTAARWRTLPQPAQSVLPTILSLGAGLAALWAAASRHRERRRQ